MASVQSAHRSPGGLASEAGSTTCPQTAVQHPVPAVSDSASTACGTTWLRPSRAQVTEAFCAGAPDPDDAGGVEVDADTDGTWRVLTGGTDTAAPPVLIGGLPMLTRDPCRCKCIRTNGRSCSGLVAERGERHDRTAQPPRDGPGARPPTPSRTGRTPARPAPAGPPVTAWKAQLTNARRPLSGCTGRRTPLTSTDMIAPEQAEPRASATPSGGVASADGAAAAGDARSYEIGAPVPADGVDMWRLAVESQTLDANSRYAYVLWCRDFARSSVIARRDDGRAVGYVTGYLRPESGHTLLIWQVCVDPVARGAGLAGRMLDAVWDQAVDAAGVHRMETTITPDNESSIRLFGSFARRHDTTIERSDLFGPELLGDEHEPEHLYEIGPIATSADARHTEGEKK